MAATCAELLIPEPRHHITNHVQAPDRDWPNTHPLIETRAARMRMRSFIGYPRNIRTEQLGPGQPLGHVL